MNLKNYTSSVPMLNSIVRIENRLAIAGATHISKSYQGGMPTGMIFQIPVNGIPIAFQLPAKVDKVYDYMIKQKRYSHKEEVKETTLQQAQMTAWKLLSDWIDIQVSLIVLDQVEAAEVFLPYAFDVRNQKTLFQFMKETNFKQLTQ
ncbi:MAG: hypothetical protein HYS25_13685 [Ignavibacteriales bacterium]|nr:hypothetical protein [Ignavibacteriales bacterium]